MHKGQHEVAVSFLDIFTSLAEETMRRIEKTIEAETEHLKVHDCEPARANIAYLSDLLTSLRKLKLEWTRAGESQMLRARQIAGDKSACN